jgi:LysM repeat protein
MQQIERVGAVALLFLLVTIVAVALWDDDAGGEAVAGDVYAAEAPRNGSGQATRGAREAQARQAAPRAAQARANQARGNQARANQDPVRDRHDGLRSTRATGGARRLEVPLTGEAGQAALVVAVDPSTLEVRVPAGEQAANRRGGRALDPELNARGFKNGGRPGARVEAAAPAARETVTPPSRKRKQAQAASRNPAASSATYTVRSNDSLERIARRQLGEASRWPEIAALNGIQGPRFLIREGQSLRLPGGAAVSAPAPAPPRAKVAGNRTAAREQAATGTRTYTIKSGDVLGKIAQRELGSSKRWPEIADLNPGLNPKTLWVGTKILLPTGGPAPTRVTERQLVASARVNDRFQVR